MINIKDVKRYCKDDLSMIENYDVAINSDESYDCHHRLEFTINCEYAHSKEELIRMNMYYNRPYFELIFMKSSEHHAMHVRHYNANRDYSFTQTQEYREKMSKSCMGKGKGIHKTDEHKKKLSDSHKGIFKGKKWKVVDGKRVWY